MIDRGSQSIDILLIEDNPGDARLIQEMLNDTGDASSYRLHHFVRLSDGLAYLRDHRVDLILSDVVLPDRQGMETVSSLRRAAENLPIVFITGSEDDELGIQAIQLGIQDYLRKGKFDGEVLVRSIRYAIERTRLERQKDDFVGIASHELRTPVTSLKAYTQVLQRRLGREGHDSAVEILGRMDEQLNRLTKLINGLLDVSRIEQGELRLDREEIAIDQLVTDVVDLVQITAPDHTINNHVATGVTILADRERLMQVLINLVTNAIKYSPGATQVDVLGEVTDAAVLVSVRDYGIGIAPDKQSKVFDRFYRNPDVQVESATGLGLGLYVASDIVRRHGGEISIVSEVSKGSTFIVRLPRSPSL